MGSYTPPERSVWEENIKHLAAVMKGYGVPAFAGSTIKIYRQANENVHLNYVNILS
jgi:hypothetical protein